MRLEQPNRQTQVDLFTGPNPDAAGPFFYWEWIRDPNAQFIQVFVIGGGGGGGAGRVGAAGTIRVGGYGGYGGQVHSGFYPAYMFDDQVVNIAAGAGGAGGAAQTVDSTDGANGTDGVKSSFGQFVTAPGGASGAGGGSTIGADAYVIQDAYTPWPGGPGGRSGLTTDHLNGGRGFGGGGGGGGGWIGGDDVNHSGGFSGVSFGLQSRTGFADVGEDGENQPAGWPLPSCGGGGGNVGAKGGNGGRYGGGGGGGGASTNGTPSGAGGNGADGVVLVVQYF